MKKISILLFPIEIIIAILAFLHLSYVINYPNIDETIIGLILILISNCICLFYICKFSKRKKFDYMVFSISLIIWMFIFLQNKYEIITFSNQKIIPIISYISFFIIILPLVIVLINYISIIKSIKNNCS